MNNETIYHEMMVHTALCTHKEPNDILIIGDEGIKATMALYPALKITTLSVDEAIDTLANMEAKSFDVVFLSTMSSDELLFAGINRVLRDDALMMAQSASIDKLDSFKAQIALYREMFTILMPLYLGMPSEHTLVISSKKYHPTADIILQRADLMDGLEYYNSDMHKAVFILPTTLNNTIKDFIKK